MKIQSLAVIFIIIIMPITMVLSEYVNNKITTEMLELEYDTRLLNSTYDAIKAYQINTINNSFGDVTNSKINDLEAAAKTFYNSIASNFNYTGYKSDVMKEYVPAIAFTMYDGYYIYSPFRNTLTEVKDGPTKADKGYDEDYSKNGEYMEGLKPYVYYSCRYKRETGGHNDDFIITYTLDNYITIQGIVGGDYVNKSGYVYSIGKDNGLKAPVLKRDMGDEDLNVYECSYNGFTFRNDFTLSIYYEELKEYIGSDEYSYVKINGKKYYLDNNSEADPKEHNIFYIDNNGKKAIQVKKGADEVTYNKYYKAITKNISAYEYYKNAYDFSKFVYDKLSDLTYNDIVEEDIYGTTSIKKTADINTKIFDFTSDSNIEYSTSSFNQHRKAVIRYVLETNLSAAISGFSSKANASNFIMPKISEDDWDTIENDVCAISFLQGLNLGAKRYNGYSVVANTLTKEYVDENDIYILRTDNTYCKVNDENIGSSRYEF